MIHQNTFIHNYQLTIVQMTPGPNIFCMKIASIFRKTNLFTDLFVRNLE